MANNTQVKKKSPIFPDIPRGFKSVDANGQFTPVWHLGFSSLFQALQRNFTNEGLLIPSLKTTDLDAIQALYTPYVLAKLPSNLPNISGKMAYDSTLSVPKMFIIVFATPDDPSSVVNSASWKTFTLV